MIVVTIVGEQGHGQFRKVRSLEVGHVRVGVSCYNCWRTKTRAVPNSFEVLRWVRVGVSCYNCWRTRTRAVPKGSKS